MTLAAPSCTFNVLCSGGVLPLALAASCSDSRFLCSVSQVDDYNFTVSVTDLGASSPLARQAVALTVTDSRGQTGSGVFHVQESYS